MKHFFRLSLLGLALYSMPMQACDVCGCGSMGFGMGDWINQGRSMLKTSYSLRSFEGPLSTDYYHQAQLTGIWALRNNWQLKLSIPYLYARREALESDIEESLNSIGDISLSVQKLLWSKMDSSDSHSLYASIGIQAPSGPFVDRPIESVIAPNFQSGSASWDLQFGLQYEYSWKTYMLIYQLAHVQNTTNRYDYRFGDQWLNSLKLARQLSLGKKLQSLLYLSIDHEYFARDVNKRGYYQYGTGGQAFFAGLGYQIIQEDWSIGLQYQIRPLPAIGEYQAKDQVNFNFSYFF